MKTVDLMLAALIMAYSAGAYAQVCTSCTPYNDSGSERYPSAKEFSAVIHSPRGGAVFLSGEKAFFQGGSDEATSTSEWSYEYSWVSSRDGIIGARKFFSTENLSLGEHVITFTVTKTNYNRTVAKTSSAQVDIRLDPADLKARIISPLPEGLYVEGQDIRFLAGVSGAVAPCFFEWTLAGGASMGSGNDFIESLAPGTYEISLKVADSGGRTVKEQTVFEVVPADKAAFTAYIVSPAENDSYRGGEEVGLIAYASGGQAPYGYSWYLDGYKVDSIKSITSGDHTLLLEVSDGNGLSQNDSLELKVAVACKTDETCEIPLENYLNCPSDCPTGSQDAYCDGARDERCDPDCGREQDPDCPCNRNGVCEPDYENYLTCPRDCASGSSDRFCDGARDERCDPDCGRERDTDCGALTNPNYFVLLMLVVVILLFYLRFVRR